MRGVDENSPVGVWGLVADYWSRVSRVSDLWWTRQQGLSAIECVRQQRLADLIRFARAASPFYRQHYHALPEDECADITDIALHDLPTTHKHQLMAQFDDWVTDPHITLRDVSAFVADPQRIGTPYLGRYSVWKSSGSTGEPGLFIHDENALSSYDALLALQLNHLPLAAQYARGYQTEGGRAALVVATGAHFATISYWQRYAQRNPWLNTQVFSITTPLPQLVAQLNHYQPAFLSSYPTLLAVLAGEQAAGRLHLHPSLLWSGGESLSHSACTAIEAAFGCPLVNEYGASECLSIAFGCRAGWLHLNHDWVILEPVDADGTPTLPGTLSDTVLLTNLANRVQPLLRYDLGDRVLINPEPCACGNPLPALRVEGRHDDVLWLRATDGRSVPLLPLALSTVVEEDAGLHHFQLVQESSDRLALRLATACQDQGETACAALRQYLSRLSLDNVRITLAVHAPVSDASGKLRQVIKAVTSDE